jgi:hypothetical protein
MHSDDAAGLFGDSVQNQSGIHGPVAIINIHKDRGCSNVQYGGRDRCKGVRWNDDLIADADLQRPQGKLQRRAAVIDGNRRRRASNGSKLSFELDQVPSERRHPAGLHGLRHVGDLKVANVRFCDWYPRLWRGQVFRLFVNHAWAHSGFVS